MVLNMFLDASRVGSNRIENIVFRAFEDQKNHIMRPSASGNRLKTSLHASGKTCYALFRATVHLPSQLWYLSSTRLQVQRTDSYPSLAYSRLTRAFLGSLGLGVASSWTDDSVSLLRPRSLPTSLSQLYRPWKGANW